jgi:hypothetical protein
LKAVNNWNESKKPSGRGASTKEDSEQDKRIRAEVFGEFRKYGRMPILWDEIEK